MKLYKELAGIIQARLNCIKSNNTEWMERHEKRIKELIDLLPHGSGIDGKTSCDLEKSTGEKIIIDLSFHHMDESGFYDGWTNHELIITPSLVYDFIIYITGEDKNDIKEYLSEIFDYALNEEVEP